MQEREQPMAAKRDEACMMGPSAVCRRIPREVPMGALHRLLATLLGAVYVAAFLTGIGCGGGGTPPPPPEHEAPGAQLFESPQADAILVSPDGTRLYVALTTMGKVRVLNTATLAIVAVIDVGMDPVSLALRPDGSELWVANHVSDSVSVISLVAGPSQHKVVETIQAVDTQNLITDFDEPIGIAFASNDKAYVALSSRNQIAVVDANTYEVTDLLAVTAQEPRAMVARGGFLFVPAFESGNKSELSACFGAPQPGDDQCTFDFNQANFATNPQMVGFPVDIAEDPLVPDRDLFVFDTTDDTLVDVVDSIGTLLYGLAVDSTGKVFVSQTDARNLVNGRAGTQGQGLADLDNRMFLNQIGVVSCPAGSCGAPSRFELEPLPPAQPAAGSQLATPYGIAVSGNDDVLVVTAAASNRVATVDAATGQVLDTIGVGNGPRAVALRSNPLTGAPLKAWVLNTLDDSISEIDVSNPANLVETRRPFYNGDKTPLAIREGRIAFNSAAASTTGTFSCASCHPDGHVDQLLWVIGARCTFQGCEHEEARSTMPVRGLRGTLPLHWDGTLGDSQAGPNGETGVGGFASSPSAPANCSGAQNCFRQLVDAAVAGVMCDQAGACPTNDVGQAGGLTAAERDAMATYLQNVQYPPARMRRFDDQPTVEAVAGFSDFYENKGGVNPPGPGGFGPETCGDTAAGSGCHALPLSADTASEFVGGFEAPTMRGITDRWLQFSAGVTNVRDLLQVATLGGATDVPWSASIGFDELTVWALGFGSESQPGAFRSVYNVGPFDIFQMIEEMTNGQSGAVGRQLTLNLRSTTGGARAATESVLAVLEQADTWGFVNLRGSGLRNGAAVTLSFRTGGSYEGGGVVLTRTQLLDEAAAGTTTLTLVAHLREAVDASTVQPTIWVNEVGGFLDNGRPNLPQFAAGNPGPITIRGRNIQPGAAALLDGLPVWLDAPVACASGTLPNCSTTQITIDLAAPPATPGLHLLQLKNPDGLLTNELPVRRQ
jgi:YVTN family beta-propeller protein